ncbi:MAG: hemerythrin domain-containing protein [Polyangiaceae bacterium]|nr:hemerythrin domain-containing protein [Polyangiaceae bacterium]
MLILKKKPTQPVKEPDCLDLMLECHDRIRRFMRMAIWLAHAEDTPANAISETAASVHRYFAEALPRHSQDEDLSLAPRLLTKEIPDSVRTSVGMMTRQHPGLEEVLSTLIPAWASVAQNHETLSDHASVLRKLTEQLQGMWLIHLGLEEDTVFPAARRFLTTSEMKEILTEMRDRRSV